MLNDQRWKLTIGAVTWVSNAILTEGAPIDYAMVTDQVFYRKTLNGQLIFTREDYSSLMAANFDTLIQVDHEELINGEWTNTYSGTFTRANCEVDEDNEVIQVRPKTNDRYTNLLDSMDKEYNIPELIPVTQQLQFSKRPILQVYLAGSSKITNILGGQYWEQDVTLPTTSSSTLIDDYKFSLGTTRIFIPGVGDGLSPDVSGEYELDPDWTVPQPKYYTRVSDSKYSLKLFGMGSPVQNSANFGVTLSGGTLDEYDDFYSTWEAGGNNYSYIGYDDVKQKHYFQNPSGTSMPTPPFTMTHVLNATNTGDLTVDTVDRVDVSFRWAIWDNDEASPVIRDKIKYAAPCRDQLSSYPAHNESAIFTSISDPTSQVKVFVMDFYVRIIFPEDTLGVLPAEDIVPKNENYLGVLGVAVDEIVITDANQSTSENYGRFADDALHFSGKYHTQQTHADPIFPVNPSEWGELSMWIYIDSANQAILAGNREDVTIRHNYKLANAVKYILAEVDSTLTHEETSAYSDFFYGASNSIRGTKRYPFISPKSNILIADYDQPASKALLKPKELFGMLKDVYNVYFDITSDNKLILEHIDYFDRGGTYNGTNLGVDLTKLIEPRTGKTRTFGTNKYTFDRPELYEILRYSWMDEVTVTFEGYDLTFTNSYVQKGNIKDIQISQFTSDIEYALASPTDVSKRGFFLFDADLTDGEYSLPFLAKTIDSVDYNLQNGYLAMVWLQENYLKYDLPAEDVVINGTATTASTIKKNKIQEINTVYDVPIINPMRLVVTGIGSGKVESISRQISSDIKKLKLRHATEES